MTPNETKAFLHEVEALYAGLMRCGTGQPFTASEACTPDGGATMLFVAQIAGDRPAESPQSVVCRSARGGHPQMLHGGPAKLLALSSSGEHVAFAVAEGTGRDRLVVMSVDGTLTTDLPSDGRIEQIAWSPDAKRVLVLVAGPGTDTTTIAGSVGGGTASGAEAGVPVVDTGAPDPEDWRRIFMFRLGDNGLEPGPPVSGMVWEASWCGDGTLAILHSDMAGEAAWYEAVLATVDLATGQRRTVFKPQRQLGHIQGCPTGGGIAFVEGAASDRGLVCGALKLIDLDGDDVETLATNPVEITSVAWRAETLLLAGQTGLKTVVGIFHLAERRFEEIWSSIDWSCGAYLPTAQPAGEDAAIAVVESYGAAPRVAILRGGATDTVCTLSGDRNDGVPQRAEPVSWRSSDGTEIEGILILPAGRTGPYPLVVDIHGGPIWAYRARWRGRQRATPALVAAGIAVLCPNPRGSFARGQDFAAAVLGDMGGADADDILSGIDYLVATGVADPDRIGLTGSSYGGYMSAWLPKLRERIAAAVCISPVSNWFSQHWTSNMPILEELFIGGSPGENGEAYRKRSPALSSARTHAATLILAGALDRCTPIGQSIELHRSLLDQGATSVLVTYPQEGHGVRSPQGNIDSAARTLEWFTRHLSA